MPFLVMGIVVALHTLFALREEKNWRTETHRWAPFLANSSVLTSLPESLPGASRLALGQKIDLNRASLADLVALPGIGPSLAERIIQDRRERGPYPRIESLTRVKGIKDKKLARLKAYITVE